MEEIQKTLDAFDVAEVDRLLRGDMRFDVDRRTRNRIAASVFAKAGVGRRKRSVFRMALLAATSVLALAVVLVVAGDGSGVMAGFRRMFGFLPGYAILESGNSILFVAGPASLERGDAVVMLRNAIAREDSITVRCDVRLSKVADVLIADWTHPTLQVVGATGGGPAIRRGYSGGGGVDDEGRHIELGVFYFAMPRGGIEDGTVLRFEYPASAHPGGHAVGIDFKLKKPDSFDALDEIGATDTHNNISITAVPSENAGVLTVDLYPVNKSGNQISSFTAGSYYESKSCRNDGLRLDTDNGVKARQKDGPALDLLSQFRFNVSPDDTGLVLKIPCLVVKTNEGRRLRVTLPPVGTKVLLDEKLKFEKHTMTIVSAERQSRGLIIGFKNDYKAPGIVFRSAELRPAGFWQALGLGRSDWSENWETTEDGLSGKIIYDLEKETTGTLSFEIAEPVYHLLGEFRLKLDPYRQKTLPKR